MTAGTQGGPSGSWLHSFEEDEGGVQVYRPAAGFDFPPSRRGRERLDFGMPGEVSFAVPGPDDRTRPAAGGAASLGAGRLRLGERQVEVVEATPQVLKVRPV
jgi:hypothetical protein